MASNPDHPGGSNTKPVSEGEKRIYPKNLSIVWGEDSRYWKLPVSDDGAAELRQVCWLEVTGSAEVDSDKNYEVGFSVSLTHDAFGWARSPLYVMTKRGENDKPNWSKEFINNNKDSDKFSIMGKLSKATTRPSEKETLYFGLYEVWSGRWKGGLKIHHAFVRETKRNL